MGAEGKQNPDFLSRVRAMAEELGLTGDDADNFVEQAVTRKGGFKKVTTWVPDSGDEGEGKKQTGWFPQS